jgi:hypothetical protein
MNRLVAGVSFAKHDVALFSTEHDFFSHQMANVAVAAVGKV